MLIAVTLFDTNINILKTVNFLCNVIDYTTLPLLPWNGKESYIIKTEHTTTTQDKPTLQL